MSTRALYTFTDQQGEYHVYKHHDGYPEGAVEFIANALKQAWPLPRFEADEFAAGFIAANKDGCGGIRLTMGRTWEDAAPGDIEYHYVVTFKGTNLHVEVYRTDCWNKPTQTLLKRGTLDQVTEWARRKAQGDRVSHLLLWSLCMCAPLCAWLFRGEMR